MIFHENCLLADYSHEISYLIFFFFKFRKMLHICCLLQSHQVETRKYPTSSRLLLIGQGLAFTLKLNKENNLTFFLSHDTGLIKF